ncbi:MAG: hypothetical protein ABSF34_02850 [Verrucomicrobiota bacterium]|jgi:hypothetical protein
MFALLALGWGAQGADFFTPSAANPSSRVVIAEGDDLLNAFLPDNARVAAVFNLGLLRFTRTTNIIAAWRSLVTTNDTVGIKVYSVPGPLNGTRPAVVAAIANGLMSAGLPPDKIIIWDKHAGDLRAAGFFALGKELGVRVMGAVEAGYDPNTFYLPDSPVIGALVWGDLEFGRTNRDAGKRSFVSKLVSQQMTKIISVAPLINENSAGVCGHFLSLALGSVDNTRRFEDDPDRLSVALPEIIALPAIGDRVALNVTDALLGQYQGGPAGYLQYSTVLDQVWLSHDPVALDVLALKELAREAKTFGTEPVPPESEIYTNAALLELGANDPARMRIEKVHQ